MCPRPGGVRKAVLSAPKGLKVQIGQTFLPLVNSSISPYPPPIQCPPILPAWGRQLLSQKLSLVPPPLNSLLSPLLFTCTLLLSKAYSPLCCVYFYPFIKTGAQHSNQDHGSGVGTGSGFEFQLFNVWFEAIAWSSCISVSLSTCDLNYSVYRRGLFRGKNEMTPIKHLVHSKHSIDVNNCNFCYCVLYCYCLLFSRQRTGTVYDKCLHLHGLAQFLEHN